MFIIDHYYFVNKEGNFYALKIVMPKDNLATYFEHWLYTSLYRTLATVITINHKK